MRAIVQRVKNASVYVKENCVGKIDQGYLIFLGVGQNDSEVIAKKLWDKIFKLRIFEDDQGKTNLNLSAVQGQVLIVSQFTLWANCKGSNRPSFTASAPVQLALSCYEHFVACAKQDVPVVETGIFGEDMQVHLQNDGPFTISLDTEQL